MENGRPRKTRGRGLRTTTGCITCRKRHLKCDEEKPVCRQCTRNKKRCTYPVNVGSSVSSIPHSDDLEVVHVTTPPAQAPSQVEQARPIDVDTASPQQPLSVEYEANNAAPQVVPEQQQDSGSNEDTRTSLETQPLDNDADLQNVIPGFNYTSPASCGTGDQPIGVATARWFGMLAGDADIDLDLLGDPGSIPREPEEFSFPGRPPPNDQYPSHSTHVVPGEGLQSAAPALPVTSPRPQEFIAQPLRWQTSVPLALKSPERILFNNFVTHVSQWLDLFDPYRHFSSLVPKLALYNVGLLNAILALSVRQNCLSCSGVTQPVLPGDDALQYYNETLQYLRRALQYETYHTSLELLATTLIISAFEMLGDGSSRDWERHLQGVFWIQRSQVIHGDSGGLRAAVWWAWLCQDMWAAFRDKRKVFTFWAPERSLRDLNATELAARSVFILGKVINFCAYDGASDPPKSIQARNDAADTLSQMLNEWESLLTPEFSPLPRGEASTSQVFHPVWIYPAPFAVAIQIHHAARILILLNRPSLGGINESMRRQIALDRHVEIICGIALTLSDYASSTISSQSLFIAGLCTHDRQRRTDILCLLEACRATSGWPANSLEEELRQIWRGSPND